MSRETEKIMKELQQFLALHGDEATDEESVDRLTRQFLLECSSYPHSRKDAAPETADDYLDLAEQASSKKNVWNISVKHWNWNRNMWMHSWR